MAGSPYLAPKRSNAKGPKSPEVGMRQEVESPQGDDLEVVAVPVWLPLRNQELGVTLSAAFVMFLWELVREVAPLRWKVGVVRPHTLRNDEVLYKAVLAWRQDPTTSAGASA